MPFLEGGGAGGSDGRVKVTGADTTPDFLANKLVTATVPLSFTVLNPGGNEDLRIDVADMVGDAGAGGINGLVPAPAAGDAAANKFLKADGTWSVPPAPAIDAGTLLFGAGRIGATTTPRYLYPGYSDHTAQTTPVRFQIPRASTLRNLRVTHSNPGGNGSLITYTLRVNGVLTGLSVTLASTSASGIDLVTSVSVLPGDLLDILVTKGAPIGINLADVTVALEQAA